MHPQHLLTRPALALAPLALAALLSMAPHAALAQVEYHSVLEMDPFRPEAYRGLRRVFTAKGEEERARLTSQVLVSLGAAGAVLVRRDGRAVDIKAPKVKAPTVEETKK